VKYSCVWVHRGFLERGIVGVGKSRLELRAVMLDNGVKEGRSDGE
jgi:hypothetical protein